MRALVYTLLFAAASCQCGPKPEVPPQVNSSVCRTWQYDSYGAKCVDPK